MPTDPECCIEASRGCIYGAASLAMAAARSRSFFCTCSRIAFSMTSKGVRPSAAALSAIGRERRVAAPFGRPAPILLPPRATFAYL